MKPWVALLYCTNTKLKDFLWLLFKVKLVFAGRSRPFVVTKDPQKHIWLVVEFVATDRSKQDPTSRELPTSNQLWNDENAELKRNSPGDAVRRRTLVPAESSWF